MIAIYFLPALALLALLLVLTAWLCCRAAALADERFDVDTPVDYWPTGDHAPDSCPTCRAAALREAYAAVHWTAGDDLAVRDLIEGR